MAVPLENLDKIPVSYASCSIGCKPSHTLPEKLNAIASAGFTGIELAMPDLVSFASMHFRNEVGPRDWDPLCSAARVVKAMCEAKELQIMLLQPFSNFEGWPEGSDERKDAFERAEGWVRIMRAVGCDTLQVGSTDSPIEKIGSDRERFVADLRQLADLLAKHHLRLAYENWCWSTHAPDWSDVWDIVQKVDRPNIGLCLDTFQTAGGEYADPSTPSGLLESKSKEEVEHDFYASLSALATAIPPEKIYMLQISDAYKPPKPIVMADETGLRPRARWSHDYRPLPFEGYLPVVDVARAVLQTGFRGWFSYEIFDGGPEGRGLDYEELGPVAENAMKTQAKLLDACWRVPG